MRAQISVALHLWPFSSSEHSVAPRLHCFPFWMHHIWHTMKPQAKPNRTWSTWVWIHPPLVNFSIWESFAANSPIVRMMCAVSLLMKGAVMLWNLDANGRLFNDSIFASWEPVMQRWFGIAGNRIGLYVGVSIKCHCNIHSKWYSWPVSKHFSYPRSVYSVSHDQHRPVNFHLSNWFQPWKNTQNNTSKTYWHQSRWFKLSWIGNKPRLNKGHLGRGKASGLFPVRHRDEWANGMCH